MGVSVREITAEIRMDTASVMANSRNSRPTTSPMNRSGISTATREMVREIMVKAICCEPLIAASSGESPCSMYLAIFSMTTMASSTTNPVEMVSAISVRLLMLKPARYITPKVPTRESGTAMLGITVAERLRRNRKITMTTSATAKINSNWTSFTEARMVVVRSESNATSTELGKDARSCGMIFLIRSTTSMTFAPG